MTEETTRAEPEQEEAQQPHETTTREMAAALVSLGIQEMESRIHQAQAGLYILQTQLQAARLRAPYEVERLSRDMEASLQ